MMDLHRLEQVTPSVNSRGYNHEKINLANLAFSAICRFHNSRPSFLRVYFTSGPRINSTAISKQRTRCLMLFLNDTRASDYASSRAEDIDAVRDQSRENIFEIRNLN